MWNSDCEAFIWDEIKFDLFGIVLNCVSVSVICAFWYSLGWGIEDSH